MARKIVHGGSARHALLGVEALEDRSVPSVAVPIEFTVYVQAAKPEPGLHSQLPHKESLEYEHAHNDADEIYHMAVAMHEPSGKSVLPVLRQDIVATLAKAELARAAGEHPNGARGAAIALEDANRPASTEQGIPAHGHNLVEWARTLTRFLVGTDRPADVREQASLFVFAALAEGNNLLREMPSAEIFSGSIIAIGSAKPAEQSEQTTPAVAELVESASLPDLGGLEAFVGKLEQRVLHPGDAPADGVPGWVLAAALTAMSCELARRQLSVPRRGALLAGDDAADTLSRALMH